jgi:hypothetical protein
MSRYFQGLYLKQIGDATGSVVVYEKLIQDCKDAGMTPNVFTWDVSNAHYMLLDWESAVTCLSEVVSNENFQNLSVCKLELACSLSMVDKIQEGMKLIEEIKTKGSNV